MEPKFKILHNDGNIFDNWAPLKFNLTFEEAQNYVKKHTNFLKDPNIEFRIEKEEE